MTIGVPQAMAPVATRLANQARHHVALRLLPVLFVLYIANYIDRSNLAYAALGITRDLGFSDRVFGLGAGIFFISYVALHVPGALLAERRGARRVIAASMIAWGSVTALTALVHTPAQLYAARFVLGAAESAFFPAVIVYLSHWFTRGDRAKATSNFMAAIPLSSVIGSSIAGWILGHKWFAVEGWRWLFILEGLPAVLLGTFAVFYLTDLPNQAKWLDQQERQWIDSTLREQTPRSTRGISVRQALGSRTILSLAAACFLTYFAFYSILFWMPSMLKRQSGLSDAKIGLLGALPYVVAFLGMLVNGWHSDKSRERHWHCAVPLLIAAAGLLGLIRQPQSFAVTVVLFIIVGFGNVYLPVFFAIPTELLSQEASAASVGMINAVGSIAGFAGPYLFGYLNAKLGSFSYGLAILMISEFTGALLIVFTPRTAQAIAHRYAELGSAGLAS